MKALTRSASSSRAYWIMGATALFLLTGCATTPPAESGNSDDADLVDVGYGKANPEHVVGSMSTVDAESAQMGEYKTMAKMLGQLPGVQVSEVGGSLSVRIRGTNSFLGGEEPLYVIDGMVVQISGAGLAGIDPNNVKSITVLKDAGSTAIYGSRGANGVIMITTKHGGG